MSLRITNTSYYMTKFIVYLLMMTSDDKIIKTESSTDDRTFEFVSERTQSETGGGRRRDQLQKQTTQSEIRRKTF